MSNEARAASTGWMVPKYESEIMRKEAAVAQFEVTFWNFY
jgi:hypothetical protein